MVEVQNQDGSPVSEPTEGHGDEGSFDWKEHIQDKSLLEDPTISNLADKSLDDVLGSHIDAQKHIGGSAKIPEPDAPSLADVLFELAQKDE